MEADEEKAVASFREHLRSKGFQSGDPIVGEDPPECYLKIGGTDYAVEVMRLVDSVPIDRKAWSRATYEHWAQCLAKEIEEEAKARKVLKGSYQLRVCGPFENAPKLEKTIRRAALQFIGSTQDCPVGCGKFLVSPNEKGLPTGNGRTDLSPEYLHGVGQKFCAITKRGSEPAQVIPRIDSPHWFAWKQDHINEARSLLQGAIFRKKHKLRGVSQPRILILPDNFRYIDTGIYKACFDELQCLEDFHTVCLVDANQQVLMVFTANKSWR